MATGLTGVVERIDDIPLLLTQMDKIQLSQRLNEVFPMHGNWQGMHAGDIVKVWLAYILSEGDHRLNHVENWGYQELLEWFLSACWTPNPASGFAVGLLQCAITKQRMNKPAFGRAAQGNLLALESIPIAL